MQMSFFLFYSFSQISCIPQHWSVVHILTLFAKYLRRAAQDRLEQGFTMAVLEDSALKLQATLLVANVALTVSLVKALGGSGRGWIVALQDYGRAMLPSQDMIFQSTAYSAILTASVTISAILIGKMVMRGLLIVTHTRDYTSRGA